MDAKAGRYFIGCDDSGHRYLVEAARRADFNAWAELDPDDENGWDTPPYAHRIDGISGIEFEWPRDREENAVLPVDLSAPPFNREALPSVREEPVVLRDGRRWWSVGTCFCDKQGVITILKRDADGHFYAESYSANT